MSELVDHLAELTRFRDRDVLDVSLASAMRDLLRPQRVAVYRCVGEAGAERWFTRANLAAGDVAASADTAWSELEQLPSIDAHRARCECLLDARVVTEAGPPALTLFPLVAECEVVGVLEVETARPLDEGQQRMVTSVLRIVRNFHDLLDYSERDTLTGLLNRKTFDERFLKAAASAALAPAAGERRSPAQGHWLGMIDIDHFKRVNDRYGHLIGDEVLLLLARVMRSSFRFHDRLYRFGGEEFVVLMRCESEANALAAFDRMRGNAERYVFSQVGHIAVSIGFTEVRAGDSPSSAFARADRAVYYAKEQGRNRVASHAALVALGVTDDIAHTGDVELF